MKVKKVNKNKKPTVQKTRKQLRKEKRQQKKVNRAQYHGQKRAAPGKFVLTSSNNEEHVSDKEELVDKNAIKLAREEEKLKRQQKIAKNNARKRKSQLLADNEVEDKMIQQMEKKLKIHKRKTKAIPKSFAAEGLDYLLDFCNEDTRKLAVEAEKQFVADDAGSDFEEDFAMVTGRDENNQDESKNSDSDDELNSDGEFGDDSEGSDEDIDEANSEEGGFGSFGEDDESEDDNEEVDLKKSSNKNKKPAASKHNFEESEDDEDFGDFSGDEDEEASEGASEADENSEKGVWEDIYGRKRDSSGNVLPSTGKYIPPAARLKQLENSSLETEKMQRLRKQLKGLINRLAEHNMHTIANEIDELYMSNSRNSMNELISKLMMESIVSPVITPDRLISEHMMLIAILHANVGTEVGAHFLLSLVKKIDEMIKVPQDVENKELDNLILMMSHLYNFKVFGSKLLYEILEKLTEKFTEKEIELILVILKTVGFLLRKDDPLALKELILKLQQRAATAESSNSRIKFMLDVLLAIKNNNMNKIPNYDPSHVEHLKKMLKTFLRRGNSVTQFNISLDDLLKVDERGKWWVVGSAWAGKLEPSKNGDKKSQEKPLYSQKILDLARKQRMNTDVRRNIFCILMTAEDYMDAFEKIHHLNLKDQQAKEIIYVLIDCCLQEKQFNPYYAVLAQKFCDFDRKNQMTLQYTLWDKLKTLEEYSNIQIRNLAKFLSHLFLERGLPLSVLKVVEFGELDKPTMRLIRQIMLTLFLHENSDECLKVFERISLAPQLQTFREGLRLFISHFLLKNADAKPLPEDQLEKLQSTAKLVDRILVSRAARTIF